MVCLYSLSSQLTTHIPHQQPQQIDSKRPPPPGPHPLPNTVRCFLLNNFCNRSCTCSTFSYRTGTLTIAARSCRTLACGRCRRARRRSTTWARSWLRVWKRYRTMLIISETCSRSGRVLVHTQAAKATHFRVLFERPLFVLGSHRPEINNWAGFARGHREGVKKSADVLPPPPLRPSLPLLSRPREPCIVSNTCTYVCLLRFLAGPQGLRRRGGR